MLTRLTALHGRAEAFNSDSAQSADIDATLPRHTCRRYFGRRACASAGGTLHANAGTAEEVSRAAAICARARRAARTASRWHALRTG